MFYQPKAVVVGAGPNGLTAAARLALEGWDVEVYERAEKPGGAATSSSGIFTDTVVDMGAASHPFGVVSPAFQALRLEEYGLRWHNAPYEMAHPFEDGESGLLTNSLAETAELLGADAPAWVRLHSPFVDHINEHLANLLRPVLGWPPHPVRMAQFGPPALLSASLLGKVYFSTAKARALLAGSAVHAIDSPRRTFTGAFGIVFGSLGMTRGWPVAEGGSQKIVDALVAVILSHEGRIHTNCEITDLRDIPRADATILNLTPRQVLEMQGVNLPHKKKLGLKRWKYGIATYKVDFKLSEPIPWSDPRVAKAGTVHVGGTVEEISRAEEEAARGRMPEKPFVMVCQQYVADPSRGMTLWTYAHVPHAYIERFPGEVRNKIIRQIERFAPGFRDVILETHDTSPAALERWNPNLIGGDIAGGAMGGMQSLARPTFSVHPHRLGKGLYLASAATPPGAGVHGMPGWWAAEEALMQIR
ncbi:phytoene desaturase family protein [Corynebacterium lactis]|uniref:phytoene desaturase family protein n=1 Tax=Corynebacterium lactis TaxID=1231000 RepID=UPI0009E956DB|nr:NAD(P)/FAD-dependent oxidoreductase [Corynebacterium lactis]